MRTPVVAGNWKMNKTRWDARDLARGVVEGVKNLNNVEVVISPPTVALSEVSDVVFGTEVGLAAQNMHWAESGAYTGESSPTMLQGVGCGWVILGHSERREYFHEDDTFVNEKVKSAIAHDLTPIMCVGETLDEREAGEMQAKVERQVRGGLASVRPEDIPSLVIAYEPIWAIGTGRTASPEQAQEVHAAIRTLLTDLYGAEIAGKTRILYGGSVKPANIEELIAQPDIDGALVGGASLSAESFVAIASACAS